MLDYSIINRKPTLTLPDKDQYLDLLATSYMPENAELYQPRVIMVNKYYVARPDLISFAIYGDDKYADIICKINGISNPFELNEDDTLILPNIEYLQNCLNNNPDPSKIIKDPEVDSIQDVDTNNYQKRKDEKRSPNEQTLGESNYVIDKSLGIVFY